MADKADIEDSFEGITPRVHLVDRVIVGIGVAVGAYALFCDVEPVGLDE